MLLMLSSSGAARAALLAVGFLTVLFYNVVLITHDKTLDFGKLSGFIYFSGVILFCFYSLIHLKRCLPMDMYGYDAIYFILLILCFAWGGDTCAYLRAARRQAQAGSGGKPQQNGGRRHRRCDRQRGSSGLAGNH